METDQTTEQEAPRKWRPLTRSQRRVAGVLIEKAKTTPDAYPMTLNALTTGCNQKSNRSPQMDLATDDVEVVLEELREMGAVAEIQGGGRVHKYRHLLYDWLSVDKVEIAVMGELLLRGEQTIGELRGRAARMEPIADLGTLRPVLQSLIDKELLISLTPEGRGQIVTHTLFDADEMKRVRERVSTAAESSAGSPTSGSGASRSASTAAELNELRAEVGSLQQALGELRERVSQLENR